jgi:hypothetical protein
VDDRTDARLFSGRLFAKDVEEGSEDMRRRSATRAGARVKTLDGLGHWWMVQDPARSAQALTSFWAEHRPA